MGRGLLRAILVALCCCWVVALAWMHADRSRARVETERTRRHRRLEDAAHTLAERVERSSGLVRALADAGSLREVVLDDAPEHGDEGWRLVDRLLPRLAAEADILAVLVVLEDGEALAEYDKRPCAAPAPLAPPARPPLLRRALDAPASVVAFDLDGACLQAAVAVGEPPRRGVVLVEVDASSELRRLDEAVDDGAWALVDAAGRVLAPSGALAIAAPPGLDPRASATLLLGDVFSSAVAVPGVRREGWQVRARAPARSAGEVLRELLLTLLVVVAPVAVMAVLFVRLRGARDAEEQRAFLQAVFDAIADPLIVVDADLTITHANKAASARHGAPLVGRPYAEAVAAGRASSAAEVEALRDVLERERGRRDEVEDGRGGAWQILRWPMPTGAVEYARDVTENKRLQAQLIQSEKLSTLGEMAAGIAHEINNPIAVVRMFAQLLQEDLRETLGPEAPALERVATIEAQAAAASEIVEGMLRFSRKSEGARQRLDVRVALQRALAVVEHRKVFEGVRLERALDVEPPPEVDGDEGQLAQVMVNLVLNAAHAMKGRGGAVAVTVTRAGEDDPYPRGRPFGLVVGNLTRVRIAVADSGTGIPTEVLDRIFEPFYTTKPGGEGTGLGLSVSFAIVREHDGCVWVDSQPGAGTTFTVDLPAAAAAPASAAADDVGAAETT